MDEAQVMDSGLSTAHAGSFMLRFFEKLSPPGIGYAVSILAVGAAFLLRSALDPILGDDYPYALFFGAVALTGLSGRTGPAFLAALSGFLLADFFFISPRHQFIFNGFELPHLLGALAYWLTAGGMILISQVTHAYAEKAQILAETLDRSQAEFRAQYELAPMGAFQTTPEGKFLIANPKFRELTGYSEEELRSRTCFQITHPDDISDNYRMHEQLLGRQIPVFALEKRYVRKDGRTIWVRCSASLRRDNHGQPQRLIGFIEDITERKEAEAVRERFFAVGADLLAIAREDGFFQWVSPAWTRALGWSGEEMTSKPWMDFIHPQDRDKTKAFVELLAGEQEMVHFENRYRTKDGKYRWLSWKNKPVGADRLWYCGATDVTSRKEAETALQEALESQRLIVESARDFAIELLDPNGVVQQWNPGAEKIFGYSASEMVGQKTDVIFTPEDRAANMPSRELETALKEDCAMDERWHQRKDGQRVYISGAVRPLYTGERVLRGFVKIGRNITERKRMEEELKESRENLERLVTNRTASLQETIQQLEQFSYSLFHDLRAPLRSMCSFAQLLQTGYGERLDSEGNDYLTRIARSAERMDHLINDVLAYRNLGLEPAKLSQVDLESLLRQIVAENIAFQPPEATVVWESPLHRVCGHEALLTQCIWNLVSNAVKFVPKDRPARIRIWTEQQGEEVRVWFEDNGIGIENTHIDRIFGMFERLHSNADYPGTGIGLTIVRKAAERMGGSVGVESEPGKGSRFWLQLQS